MSKHDRTGPTSPLINPSFSISNLAQSDTDGFRYDLSLNLIEYGGRAEVIPTSDAQEDCQGSLEEEREQECRCAGKPRDRDYLVAKELP